MLNDSCSIYVDFTFISNMTPFVTLIIASGSRQIMKTLLPVFFLSLIYFIVLIIDIFRKKISGIEIIVSCILYFLDISLKL